MPIKAIFAPGQTEITVNGLHQWDYGQKLEIHSSDLPTVVEVHFACVGMTEAVVRTCEVSAGKATVSIPDICLEHTTPITAWVFEINGTVGTTTKKITLPIETRTKPSKGADIPVEATNKYTELITAINNAIGRLTLGEVKAKNAENADQATKATQDGDGNVISSTYATKSAITSGEIVAKESKHAETAGSVDAIKSGFKKYTVTTSESIPQFSITAKEWTDKAFILCFRLASQSVEETVFMGFPSGNGDLGVRAPVSSISFNNAYALFDGNSIKILKKDAQPESLVDNAVYVREL